MVSKVFHLGIRSCNFFNNKFSLSYCNSNIIPISVIFKIALIQSLTMQFKIH